jgi:hypothetical protein
MPAKIVIIDEPCSDFPAGRVFIDYEDRSSGLALTSYVSVDSEVGRVLVDMKRNGAPFVTSCAQLVNAIARRDAEIDGLREVREATERDLERAVDQYTKTAQRLNQVNAELTAAREALARITITAASANRPDAI